MSGKHIKLFIVIHVCWTTHKKTPKKPNQTPTALASLFEALKRSLPLTPGNRRNSVSVYPSIIWSAYQFSLLIIFFSLYFLIKRPWTFQDNSVLLTSVTRVCDGNTNTLNTVWKMTHVSRHVVTHCRKKISQQKHCKALMSIYYLVRSDLCSSRRHVPVMQSRNNSCCGWFNFFLTVCMSISGSSRR